MRRDVIHHVIGLVLLCAPVGCGSLAPLSQPILARGDTTLRAEDASAAQDLRACRATVQQTAPVTIQPRWLPPLGFPDSGAVIGTVDVPHIAWRSRQTYRDAIARCLETHGYTVQGWQ